MKKIPNFLFVLILAVSSFAVRAENSQVLLQTDLGNIRIELYDSLAPITVKNFLDYVDSGFYNGTIFHRVIPGFVAQGGGYTFDFAEKKTNPEIKNESDNGLKNDYKTIAMARMPHPDSASSQFYFNLKDNPSLNAKVGANGYTVFGRVVDGMEVVEKIAKEPTGMYKSFPEAPNYAVRILSAKRVTAGSITTNSSTPSRMENSRIKDALISKP
jgi:peptidyl-prolyl cis-trans isomerase A (cyclophilin A)